MKPATNLPKITPPDVSRTIVRPRLFGRISEQIDKKLIFVLGQAAQGKSTLAASYLTATDLSPAWLNLAAEDSDPVNLFHSIILSIESVFSGVDFSVLKDLPAVSAGPRDILAQYREWVHSIFTLVPKPFHLVLDGVDRLTGDAASYAFLQVLIAEKPPEVHLWILSRIAKPFQIEQLKISQKAVLLDNNDLSFNKEEISLFFKKIKNENLNTRQIEKIHALTEGWIGGLILLSEGLNRLPADSREKYIFKDVSAQFKTEAFHYFGNEIISSQPYATQRFLFESSVFDTIEPRLLKHLTNAENADQILHGLVDKNLFVQSIYDDQKGLIFRYHQLFKDFLQSKFNSEIPEKDKLALWAIAGSASELIGYFENAANFYLKARLYQKAEKIIETTGAGLLKMGRTADLSNLLSALPEKRVHNNPWLLLYMAITKRYTDADENTANLQKALTLFKQEGVVRGQLLTLAYLIEATVFRGRDIVPMAVLLEEGEALLHTLAVEQYPWESATLWYQIGFGYALRGANQRKAFQYCQNAYVLAKSIGNQPLQIYALATAMFALSLMGEFSMAAKISDKIENLTIQLPYQELRAYQLIMLGQSCTVKGDLEKARTSIKQANDIIENQGLMYLYPVSLFSDLMLRPHLREFKRGKEIGDQLLQLTLAFGMEFMHGVAAMFVGLNYYLGEEYPAARQWIGRSCQIVSSDESYSDTHVAWNKIIMGLILYHIGDAGRAAVFLKEALHHFREISSPLTLVVVHVALALVSWKTSEPEKTAIHLEKGFKIAADNQFYHFIFLNRPDLVKACLLAIELNVTATRPYVTRLLASRFPDIAAIELVPLTRHGDLKIKKNARSILKTVHCSTLPKLRVETLNGFSVRRGKDVITPKEWAGNVPKLFLKLIIARGLKNIPRDLIMEDLWPDENQKASDTNFKVNLHRLRKLIEPSMRKELGSSYIFLKDNLISLDEKLWQLDIVEFTDFKRKAEIAEADGHARTAISFFNKAAQLYRRDFLADDLYIEAINSCRVAFRRQYLTVLHRLADLYEKKGALKKAAHFYRKIMGIDPIAEAACQKLMLNYANRGRRNDAIRLFECFIKTLKSEVASEPDHLTFSIYRKILYAGKEN